MVLSLRNQFVDDSVPDHTIRRFCVAREWDEKAAAEMLRANLKWRRESLPVERSPAIERVLESGRLRVLRRGRVPILAVDFMWGKFLLDDYKDDDIMMAQFLLVEDILAEADALGPEDEPA